MALATLDQLGKLFHAVQLRLTVIVTVNHLLSRFPVNPIYSCGRTLDEPGRRTWS